jgi:ABC-2 type transport system permease protein
MRNAWTIARREYHRYFSSPIAYVVAFVMLLTLGIMFAVTIMFYRQNALGAGQGAPAAPDMSGLTGTFAFILILMVPAITMRLVADENRMGTMELLLTAPVRDWELIVGKWLGALLYMLTLIASTLVFAFILMPGIARIDQQQLMTSYGPDPVTGALLPSAASRRCSTTSLRHSSLPWASSCSCGGWWASRPTTSEPALTSSAILT